MVRGFKSPYPYESLLFRNKSPRTCASSLVSASRRKERWHEARKLHSIWLLTVGTTLSHLLTYLLLSPFCCILPSLCPILPPTADSPLLAGVLPDCDGQWTPVAFSPVLRQRATSRMAGEAFMIALQPIRLSCKSIKRNEFFLKKCPYWVDLCM